MWAFLRVETFGVLGNTHPVAFVLLSIMTMSSSGGRNAKGEQARTATGEITRWVASPSLTVREGRLSVERRVPSGRRPVRLLPLESDERRAQSHD